MKTLRIISNRQVPAPPPPKSVKAGQKRMHFDAHMSLSDQDAKKFDVVKNGDEIVDYKNVTIKGYLSTFKSTTEADRQGDYVEPGAFTETIPMFMKNPVLLVNHQNTVQNIAGKFTTVREDAKGLYVEAQLSNSPAEWTKDVRFKVAEGSLRTMSMGGVFHYKEDRRGIFKVMLWEGSLTPVPANPDATFSVRELTAAEMQKAESDK